jgi:hypothetical protein
MTGAASILRDRLMVAQMTDGKRMENKALCVAYCEARAEIEGAKLLVGSREGV